MCKVLINEDTAPGQPQTQAEQESVRVPVQKHHKYSPAAKGPLRSFTKSHHRNNLQANNAEQLHFNSLLSFISGFHTLSCSHLPGWHWTNVCQVEKGERWSGALSLLLMASKSGEMAFLEVPNLQGELCVPFSNGRELQPCNTSSFFS